MRLPQTKLPLGADNIALRGSRYLSPGVAPGGRKMVECLERHENDISVSCAKVLKAIKAKMSK
jgi:hypothetical protein